MDEIRDIAGVTVLMAAADGPPVATEGDATDLIGEALGGRAEMIVMPVARLHPDFLDLSTRMAGLVIQKFTNYRLRAAILGDIGAFLDRSEALRAFVVESNRGQGLWFVADEAALAARLRTDG
ncbi:MAG: DUF4180 domain-containing protein [Caulobacter sp.]|nr:DUF4180 domain-containing protein [Caulobacter sp.]